jgi:putative PIN family toxin of toxin-antitoxin system
MRPPDSYRPNAPVRHDRCNSHRLNSVAPAATPGSQLRAVGRPSRIHRAISSASGPPTLRTLRLFRYGLEGAFELVVSPLLLDELERALGYSKLRDRVTTDEAQELVEVLARAGVAVRDPDVSPEIRSPDPDEDYLIALASVSRSALISGDTDLLGPSDQIPVYSPAEFLAMIENRNSSPT